MADSYHTLIETIRQFVSKEKNVKEFLGPFKMVLSSLSL